MTATPRPLHFWDLVLATVAMSLSVRWISVAAAAGPASLPLWALAMAGFMAPLVVATAELTTRFPEEGGIYAWTRETLGPFAGFVCGWLYWTCNLPFFSGLLFFIVNMVGEAGGPPARAALANPALFTLATTLVALAVAGLHLLGFGAGKWVSNIGAASALVLLLFLLLAGAGLALARGPATDFLHADYRPPLDANGAILWSTLVFAFGGAEALALLRNEIAGGIRQVVRVLAVVALLMVLLYSGATAGMLAILPGGEVSRLSGLPDALRASLAQLGVPGLAPIVLLGAAAASLGGYSAWFGVAARLPFVAGVDHYLPRAFAYRNPGTGAPTVSLLMQLAATVALVLLSQAGANAKAAYDFLVSMTVLSYTLPYLFMFAAYVRVQARRPTATEAWTPPGGAATARVTGIVGFAVALSAILCTLVPSPDAADKVGAVVKILIASALLVFSGVAVYAVARRRQRLAVLEPSA